MKKSFLVTATLVLSLVVLPAFVLACGSMGGQKCNHQNMQDAGANSGGMDMSQDGGDMSGMNMSNGDQKGNPQQNAPAPQGQEPVAGN